MTDEQNDAFLAELKECYGVRDAAEANRLCHILAAQMTAAGARPDETVPQFAARVGVDSETLWQRALAELRGCVN